MCFFRHHPLLPALPPALCSVMPIIHSKMITHWFHDPKDCQVMRPVYGKTVVKLQCIMIRITTQLQTSIMCAILLERWNVCCRCGRAFTSRWCNWGSRSYWDWPWQRLTEFGAQSINNEIKELRAGLTRESWLVLNFSESAAKHFTEKRDTVVSIVDLINRCTRSAAYCRQCQAYKYRRRVARTHLS